MVINYSLFIFGDQNRNLTKIKMKPIKITRAGENDQINRYNECVHIFIIFVFIY